MRSTDVRSTDVLAVVGSDNPVEIDAGSFCRSLYPRLVGALSLNCGNREDAQELAQETLSRVLEHWDRLREHDDPEAWAFRTTFSTSPTRGGGGEWSPVVSTSCSGGGGATKRLHSTQPTTRSTSARVATLPRRQREAVVLRYFVDCSVSETAARMGCAEGTVKALTHQAIDTLRQTALPDLEETMMSDLRRRLHAAAATPDSELDTEALRAPRSDAGSAAPSRSPLRRRSSRSRPAVACSRPRRLGKTTLRTAGRGSETTLAPSTSAPPNSTSTTTSTTIATTPGPNATVPAPASGGPSWNAAPTTGIELHRRHDQCYGDPERQLRRRAVPEGPPRRTFDFELPAEQRRQRHRRQPDFDRPAFWWMSSARVDCGAAPGTCVVGFMSADPRSTFTPVSFDLAFDPAKRPRIEVTPSAGLDDGQQIEVRGLNLGAGTVSFAECLGDQWASCAYTDASTGVDGSFVATYSVQRVLHWSYHGTMEESGECGVDGGCVITTWVTPAGFEDRPYSWRELIEPNAPVAITFAPAPPPTTTTTTP